MIILDRRQAPALTAGAALSTSLPSRAATAASTEVFTADGAGALVDSVIIEGEAGLLLVDAQMTAANATRLADRIAATGKPLETVFITHYHPDHVLGLGILLERFPDARAVTHAAVRPKIEQTAQAMLDQFSTTPPRVTLQAARWCQKH